MELEAGRGTIFVSGPIGDEEFKEIQEKLPTLGILESMEKYIHFLLLPKINHKLCSLK